MNTRIAIAIFASAVIGWSSGFEWKSSEDAGGPMYQWESIATTANQLSSLANSDGGSQTVALPFAFPIVAPGGTTSSNTSSSLTIYLDGYCRLSNSASAYVYVFQEDLVSYDDVGADGVYYVSSPEVAIVEWSQMLSYGSYMEGDVSAKISFQMRLYPDGRILLLYNEGSELLGNQPYIYSYGSQYFTSYANAIGSVPKALGYGEEWTGLSLPAGRFVRDTLTVSYAAQVYGTGSAMYFYLDNGRDTSGSLLGQISPLDQASGEASYSLASKAHGSRWFVYGTNTWLGGEATWYIADTVVVDRHKPAVVTDLATAATLSDGFTLRWTTPRDSLAGVAATRILVRNSPSQAWTVAATIASRKPYGAVDSETVQNLDGGHDYSFALVTEDQAGNVSDTSNLAIDYLPADESAPAKVMDLAAVEVGRDTLLLSFTMPGDDGLLGSVAGMQLRIAPYAVTATNFAALPEPEWVWSDSMPTAGSTAKIVVRGLDSSTTYYLALKGYDEAGNHAALSNVVQVKTTGAPNLTYDRTRISVQLAEGTSLTEQLTVGNAAGSSAPLSVDLASSRRPRIGVLGLSGSTVVSASVRTTLLQLTGMGSYDLESVSSSVSDAALDSFAVVVFSASELSHVMDTVVEKLVRYESRGGGVLVAASLVDNQWPTLASLVGASGFTDQYGWENVQDAGTGHAIVEGLSSGASFYLSNDQNYVSSLGRAVGLIRNSDGYGWLVTVDASRNAVFIGQNVSDFYSGSSQTRLLLANSLNWLVARSRLVTPAPSHDEFAVGDARAFMIKLDGSRPSGTYLDTLLLSSSDPLQGLVRIPIVVAVVDTVAPAAVSDLRTSWVEGGDVGLAWNAPGDNGTQGRATAYQVRYATDSLTAAGWNGAMAVTAGIPLPGASGSVDSVELAGLEIETLYWIAIRAVDEAGNQSAVTVVRVQTTGIPAIMVTPSEVTWTLEESGTTRRTLQVNNTGAGALRFGGWTGSDDGAVSLGADADTIGVSESGTVQLSYAPLQTLGGFNWYVYDDRTDAGFFGSSVATLTVRTATQVQATLTIGSFESENSQYAALEGRFSAGSMVHADTLVIRGTFTGSSLRLVLKQSDITDFDYYSYTLPTSSSAQDLRIPLSSFSQQGFGEAKVFRPDLVDRITIQRSITGCCVSGTSTVTVTGVDWKGFQPYRSVGRYTDTLAVLSNAPATPSFPVIVHTNVVDNVPPATPEATVIASSGNSLTLRWLATGDNGSSGLATAYEVRYSTDSLTAIGWTEAQPAAGTLPIPRSVGLADTFAITGLAQETVYYIVVRVLDERSNASTILSALRARTTASPAIAFATDTLQWTVYEDASDSLDVSFQNDGDDTLRVHSVTLSSATGLSLGTVDSSVATGESGSIQMRYTPGRNPGNLSGLSWYTYDDGASTVAFSDSSRDTITAVLDLNAGGSDGIYAGFGSIVGAGFLSGTDTLVIQYRLTGSSVRMRLEQSNVTDFDYHGYTLNANDSLTTLKLPLTSSYWTQQGWGTNQTFAKNLVTAISFQLSDKSSYYSQLTLTKVAWKGSTDPIHVADGIYHESLTVQSNATNAPSFVRPVLLTVLDTMKPEPVSGFALQVLDEQSVRLSWTSGSDDDGMACVAGFEIYYAVDSLNAVSFTDGALWTGVQSKATCSGAALVDTVTGLDALTRYYFAVRAVDSSGNASLVTETLPATTMEFQGKLEVTSIDASAALRLTFPNSYKPEGVIVLAKQWDWPTGSDDAEAQEVSSLTNAVAGAALEDTALGLSNGTTWYFVAYFRDSAGTQRGADSVSLLVRDLQNPGPVTSLSSTATDGNVSLQFNAPSDLDLDSILVVLTADGYKTLRGQFSTGADTTDPSAIWAGSDAAGNVKTGGWWYGYTDQNETTNGGPGASTTDFPADVSPTEDETGSWVQSNDGLMDLTYTLGVSEYQYPYAGVAFNWLESGGQLDVSSHTGLCVTYSLSGSAPVYIEMKNEDSFDEYNSFRTTIPPQSSLTTTYFPFSGFTQESGWGVSQTVVAALQQSLGMKFVSKLKSAITDSAYTAHLVIQDIRWEGACNGTSSSSSTVATAVTPGQTDVQWTSDAENGATYVVSIVATDTSGNRSTVVLDTLRPVDTVAPAAPELTALGSDSIVTLAIHAPADSDLARIQVYALQGATYPTSPSEGALVAEAMVTPGSEDTLYHADVSNSVRWSYAAFAIDDDGLISPAGTSTTLTLDTVPTDSIRLFHAETGEPGGSSVKLSWVAPGHRPAVPKITGLASVTWKGEAMSSNASVTLSAVTADSVVAVLANNWDNSRLSAAIPEDALAGVSEFRIRANFPAGIYVRIDFRNPVRENAYSWTVLGAGSEVEYVVDLANLSLISGSGLFEPAGVDTISFYNTDRYATYTYQIYGLAPGGRPLVGTVSHYDVRYTLSESCDAAQFDAGTALPETVVPISAGMLQTLALDTMPANTDYCFTIQARDTAGHLSEVASAAFRTGEDYSAPTQVIDLAAAPAVYTSGGSLDAVSLTWTAPDADEFGSGTRVAGYSIRWSTSPITTDAEFNAATEIESATTPKLGGEAETLFVSGLPAADSLYFALKSGEVSGNVSALSNNASTALRRLGVRLAADGVADGQWRLSGLWNLRPAASTYGRVTQGTGSFWYGDPATGTFATGLTTSGDLVSPEFAVGESPVLVFDQWAASGTDPYRDLRMVLLSSDGGSSWTRIFTGDNSVQEQWTSDTLDLSSWAGDSVKLRFRFTSMDTLDNQHEGWYVDNIRVYHVGEIADTVAPSAVTGLEASAQGQSVTLRWIASGDDLAEGTASILDVRYSTDSIVESDWDKAIRVLDEEEPKASGTADSLVIEGLAPSTRFYFAVRTADEVGNLSPLSAVVNASTAADTIAPSAVSDLKVVQNDQSGVGLLWTASGNDGKLGQAEAYELRYSATEITDLSSFLAGTETVISAPSASGQKDSALITGLSVGTQYWFALRVRDSAGNWSDLSNILSVTTAADHTGPAQVAIPVIDTAQDGRLVFHWTNPSDADYAGVRLLLGNGYYPSSPTDSVLLLDDSTSAASSVLSFALGGLNDGVQQMFALYAYDTAGNYSEPRYFMATTHGTIAPDPLTGLVILALDGAVKLSWTNPVSTMLDSVRILWSTAQVPSSPADPSASTMTVAAEAGAGMDLTLENLTNNQEYYVSLWAMSSDPLYSTAVSDSAIPTDTLAPEAPDTLILSYDSSSVVSVRFRPTTGATYAWVHILDDKAGLDEYGYFLPIDLEDLALPIAGYVTQPLTSFGDNRWIYVSVVLTDADGDSSAAILDSIYVPDISAPSTIWNLVEASGEDTVQYTWNNPSDGDLAGVMVRYTMDATSAPGAPSEGTLLADLDTSVTTVTQRGLASEHTYRYSFFAYDSSGNYSNPVSATLLVNPEGRPDAPSTPEVVLVDRTRVYLKWSGITAADQYLLYRSTASDPEAVAGSLDTILTDTSVVLTLPANETSYFRLRYVASGDTSLASGTARATTSAMPTSVASLQWYGDYNSWQLDSASEMKPTAALDVWESPVFNLGVGDYRFRLAEEGDLSAAQGGVLSSVPSGNILATFNLSSTEDYMTITNPMAGKYKARVDLGAGLADLVRQAPQAPAIISATGYEDSISLYIVPNGTFQSVSVYRGSDTVPTGQSNELVGSMTSADFMAVNQFTDEDNALTTGHVYYYRAIAYDESGEASFQSNSVSASLGDHQAPAIDGSSLVVTTGKNQITANWELPLASDLAGMKLLMRTDRYPTGPNDAYATVVASGSAITSWDSTGLMDGSTYYFRLYAYDEVPNYASLEFHAVPGDPVAPAAIADLRTLSTRAEQFQLVWTAPGDDGAVGQASRYHICYRQGSVVTDANFSTATCVGENMVPDVAGAAETLQIQSLLVGATYSFAIRTEDASGNLSPISNVLQVTITDSSSLPAPTGLVAVASSHKVILSWEALSGAYIGGYAVYRGRTPDFAASASNRVSLLGRSAATFTDTGLTNGVTYYYRVATLNLEGTAGTPCAAVSGSPSVYTVSAGSFQLTTDVSGWAQDTSANLLPVGDHLWAKSFVLTRGTHQFQFLQGSGSGVEVIGDDSDPVEGSGTILYQGTADRGLVRAFQAYVPSNGTYRVQISDATLAYRITTEAPSRPTGIAASLVGSGVQLSWNRNPESDIAAYSVYRTDSAGMTPTTATRIGTVSADTLYLDPAPTDGMFWTYQVSAVDVNGNEGMYAQVSVYIPPEDGGEGDDDVAAPTIVVTSPVYRYDSSTVSIQATITDASGIYDDATGSGGQGVYLLWDTDGELVADANEIQMSKSSGSTYVSDVALPSDPGTYLVAIHACDNDADNGDASDRLCATSSSFQYQVFDDDMVAPIIVADSLSLDPTTGAFLVRAALYDQSGIAGATLLRWNAATGSIADAVPISMSSSDSQHYTASGSLSSTDSGYVFAVAACDADYDAGRVADSLCSVKTLWRTLKTSEDVSLHIAASSLEGAAILTGASSAVNGSVSWTSDSLTFVPTADFHGLASFNYNVYKADWEGIESWEAAVSVIVAPVNDAPLASADQASMLEDGRLAVATATLLANDNDSRDSGTVSLSAVFGAVNGKVSQSGDSVIFVPTGNFNGTAGFQYSIVDAGGLKDTAVVAVMVIGVNDKPVAVDDTAGTNEDEVLRLSAAALLSDDSDTEDTTDLTFLAVFGAVNGSVVYSGDTISFTPAADFHGTASFRYSVMDAGGLKDTALVVVTVSAVNDPPVAVDDTTSTDEDVTLSLAASLLLANDQDAKDTGSVNLSAVFDAANGKVSLSGTTVSFVPTSDFSGTASFRYSVVDAGGLKDTALVTVYVASANDKPVAADDTASTNEDVALVIGAASLLANDADTKDTETVTLSAVFLATRGVVTLANETITFTPAADFHGTASFQYSIVDAGGLKDTALVTVHVASVNDKPIAMDDTASTKEDVALTIAASRLLANDNDSKDTGSVSLVSVFGAVNGKVGLSGTIVTFTPAADFYGTASFQYVIQDAGSPLPALLDTGTVVITVTDVADDVSGPVFALNGSVLRYDSAAITIQMTITDTSGVYDDTTGSGGQGIYLLWDSDGELTKSAKEIRMHLSSGNVYVSDSALPSVPATNVFTVRACDNNATGRNCATSAMFQIQVVDEDEAGPSIVLATAGSVTDTSSIQVSATITDPNGVNASSVLLLWDTDGDLDNGCHRVPMSKSSGNLFMADSVIPSGSAAYTVAMVACDNDHDGNRVADSTCSMLGPQIIGTDDDDAIPPSITIVTPSLLSDSQKVYVQARIVDASGIYDDTTGSNGQGVYLWYDDDGELDSSHTEIRMSLDKTTGLYTAASPLPSVAGSYIVQVFAWDNDNEGGAGDRSKGESNQTVLLIADDDTKGPDISVSTVASISIGDTLVVTAVITDASGVLKGSVQLLWDMDGDLSNGSDTLRMSAGASGTYTADVPILRSGSAVILQVIARDNDLDGSNAADASWGSSVPVVVPISSTEFAAGKVLDASGNPVSDAQVRILAGGSAHGFLTDTVGVFSLAWPSSVPVELTIQAPGRFGYQDSTKLGTMASPKKFRLYAIGNFNKDTLDAVDGDDLALFGKHWGLSSKDDDFNAIYDIGPSSGAADALSYTPDGIIDFEDLMSLARVWNFHQSQSLSLTRVAMSSGAFLRKSNDGVALVFGTDVRLVRINIALHAGTMDRLSLDLPEDLYAFRGLDGCASSTSCEIILLQLGSSDWSSDGRTLVRMDHGISADISAEVLDGNLQASSDALDFGATPLLTDPVFRIVGGVAVVELTGASQVQLRGLSLDGTVVAETTMERLESGRHQLSLPIAGYHGAILWELRINGKKAAATMTTAL